MTRRRKKTSFVPRIVLGASFVGVIPACALTACGGPDPILSLGNVPFGVAAVAFCCFEAGVADIAFGGDAKDAAVEAADATDEDAAPGDADASDSPD